MIYHVDFPSGQLGRYGGDTTLMSEFYSTLVGGLIDDPRPGADGVGKVFTIGQGTNTYMIIPVPDVEGRFVFSFRIYFSELPSSNNRAPTFTLYEDNDDVPFSLSFETDGFFYGGYLVPRAWQLIEVMMGGGVGFNRFIVKIDGMTVRDSGGGQIYRPPEGDPGYSFRITVGSGAPNGLAIKDFILQGNTDAAFPGPCNVRDLMPIADVSSGWTKTGGATEFGILNNTPPLDAQNVGAGEPPPAPSVTEIGGLLPNTKAIRGLLPSSFMSGGGIASPIQTSLVVGGVPRVGELKYPNVVPHYFEQSLLVDPVTGVPWTVADVENMRISLNRTV